MAVFTCRARNKHHCQEFIIVIIGALSRTYDLLLLAHIQIRLHRIKRWMVLWSMRLAISTSTRYAYIAKVLAEY